MSVYDYQVGDHIVVSKSKKEGIVRFVGETDFAPGVWYGVSLLNGTGKNDGSINGKRYFKCTKSKGIFLKKERIKGLKSQLSNKSNTSINKAGYGNIMDMYNTNTVSSRGRKSIPKQAPPKKLGPRDVGRNKEWKPPQYDTNDNTPFLAEKTHVKVKSRKNNEFAVTPSKPGPRDIGRNKEYKGIDFSENSNESFLKDRAMKKRPSKEFSDGLVPYKQGPREIGRNKEFKGPKYTESGGNQSFLSEKNMSRKTNKTSGLESVTPYKEGPRDIGWNKEFKGPNYDTRDNSYFLDEKPMGVQPQRGANRATNAPGWHVKGRDAPKHKDVQQYEEEIGQQSNKTYKEERNENAQVQEEAQTESVPVEEEPQAQEVSEEPEEPQEREEEILEEEAQEAVVEEEEEEAQQEEETQEEEAVEEAQEAETTEQAETTEEANEEESDESDDFF